VPSLARIKAIELILNYAYGTPGIATIVKYEIDIIIKEYGLPPRHKLVDRSGNKLFKSHGQYKPSTDLSSSLKRHQFIERMEEAYLRDDDEVQNDASSKLHPTITTYDPPLKPKSEALKRLTAEQKRVDQMKSQIRQAEHDLKEMKDIYDEANKTLTAMRQAYMNMPPDPPPQQPAPKDPTPQAMAQEPPDMTPEPIIQQPPPSQPYNSTDYARWKALSE
jgi:hypothetical protein